MWSRRRSTRRSALKVSLDKGQYRVGDTAGVHLESRFGRRSCPGPWSTTTGWWPLHSVEVPARLPTTDIPVTRDWGPGAYVHGRPYRRMDLEANAHARRAPSRLAWAGSIRPIAISTSAFRRLKRLRPRQLMDEGDPACRLTPVAEAYRHAGGGGCWHPQSDPVSNARPENYYFGQRRLGMSIATSTTS
jgi:hypothetical protein